MKKDPRVDAYIARSAPFARPILEHLRSLVHEGCPDGEETLKWSAPSFVLGGKIVCGMAAFKEHCALFFWHAGMKEALGKDLKEGEAMGSLGRITSLDDLPSDAAMRRHLEKAVALAASGAPSRPPAAKRAAAPVEVPAELAAALKANGAASAFFASLSPGQKREYVDWITEAKRDETRAKRLATAVEWLAEGKKRNWKYESC